MPASDSTRPESTAGGERSHYLERELYDLIRSGPLAFDFLQNGSLDGLWYWDLERPEHTWMSPRLKEVLGFADHEVPNTAEWWQSRLFPEDLALALENYRKHLEDPAHPYDQIVRYRHKDGSTVWVRCRGLVVRNDAGTPVRMIGAHTDVTAIKVAEERYRALHEGVPDIYFSVDLDSGRITDCNQVLADAAQLPKSLIVGRPFGELFHAAAPSAAAETLTLLRSETPALNVEVPLERSDGRQVPVLFAASVRGVSAAASEVGVWGRDITHLKRLVNVEVLLDALPHGALLADASGRIVSANRVVERMFGYEHGELNGQGVDVLLPESLRDRHKAFRSGYMRSSAARMVGSRDDLRARKKTGEEFPAQVGLTPMTTREGTFVLATVMDVSGRNALQQAVRTSDALRSAVLDSVLAHVAVLDTHGTIVAVNEAWRRFARENAGGDADLQAQLGVGANYLDATRAGIAAGADDAKSALRCVSRVLAGGPPCTVEYPCHSPNDERWFLMSVTPLGSAGQGAAGQGSAGQGAAGQGAVVAHTNITDRKRAELAQLRSQKLEALGVLAGGIAHDFNNLLLAIVGNTAMACAELPADHPAVEHMKEVERAGIRAAELVRRILAFSRPADLDRRAVALGPVVAEALQLMRATIPAMIAIRHDAPPDLPLALADPTQVHQVVVNLVTNSAHAIGARGGSVDVTMDAVQVDEGAAGPELAPGSYVRVSVADTGSGMGKDALSRVFDPFFTTKPPGQGTGLGLSVVHGIMASHGGAVTVTSQPEAGATFRLYFPSTSESAAQPAAAAPDTPRGNGERILYLDDEQALVRLAERMLRRLGYEVAGFTDAARALDAFRASPDAFHAVVTDVSMPGISGYECVRELLALRPDIPILMTSGNAGKDDMASARRAGARGMLAKPHSFDDLGRAVARVLHPDRT